MGRPIRSIFAGAIVAGFSTAAFAADLPPVPVLAPVPVVIGTGWYLRGDIGFSNQSVDQLDNVLFTPDVTVLDKGFDGAPFFGVGVGYRFNSYLRVDVTGEYRSRANFHGLDRYVDPTLPTGFGTNDYSGSKSEIVGLANFYLDLGTYGGVTPFVGAGIGFANNTINSFRDVNIATGGLAFGREASKTNFAYALYAGAAYDVTPGFTMEFAYRYLNLGDGQSGDLETFSGVNAIVNPMLLRDLTSHDIRMGFRWALAAPVAAAAPLVRKY